MTTWEEKNRNERLSYFMALCIMIVLTLWALMLPFIIHNDIKKIEKQVTEINDNMKAFLL